MSNELQKIINKLCREIVGGGGNTRYMWLEDADYQYEVEIVICKMRDKRMNVAYNYSKPTGIYFPETEQLH